MATDPRVLQASDDEHWMRLALEQASVAARLGEVPVGAVVVRGEECLGIAHNEPVARKDPTAHAEILALRRAACALGNYRLPDTTLYVTIEPCAMCVGAMIHARISRLVYGALEPRAGAVTSAMCLFEQSAFNHRVEVSGGVLGDEARRKMQQFFAERR